MTIDGDRNTEVIHENRKRWKAPILIYATRTVVFEVFHFVLRTRWLCYVVSVGHTPAPCQTRREGQHPLTGQRAANFRLLANQ